MSMKLASIHVLFLLWCATVAVNAQDAGDQLQVGLSFVPNDIVSEGDTVQVVCNVTGDGPIMNFTWLSNDNIVVENYRVGIHLDLGSRTSTLQISHLRFSDAGNYTCQAIIGGVTHSSSPGVLQVASRLIVGAFYAQKAFEGGEAVVVCNVSSYPPPTLRWYRDSSDPPNVPIATQQTTDVDFGILKFPNVSLAQTGTYICQGSYDYGTKEVAIDFIVLTNEAIHLSFIPNNFVPEGGNVQVVCDVISDGFIIRNIVWLHNDNIVVDGGRVNIEHSVPARTSTLHISSFRFSDAGTYTCQAIIGFFSHSSSSGVLQIATGVTIEAFYVQKAIEGNDAVLVCNVSSSPPPTLRWYRGSSDSLNVLITTQQITDVDFGLLKFPNVSLSQAGMYICHGSNAIGARDVEIDFIVLTPRAPVDVQWERIDSGRVGVSWHLTPPVIDRVIGYTLRLLFYVGSVLIEEHQVASYISSTIFNNSKLVAGIPYSVTVQPEYSAGLGKVGHVPIEYSQELIPNVAPIIDEALTLRLDGTHLLLTIVPLDPIQARGLVSEYIVSLTPVDPSQRMQGPSGSIQAGSTSTVIGGLNSDKAYSVAVAARTGAGLGIASVGFEVSILTSSVGPSTTFHVVVGAVMASVVLLLIAVVVVVIVWLVLRYNRATVALQKGSRDQELANEYFAVSEKIVNE